MREGISMAKFRAELDERLTEYIRGQKIFFTATAPREGRINLSPKGMDTFRILGNTTVAYLDLTGSGNETSAHLLENGRMTVMFCSFSEKPLILRLYGRGRVVGPKDPEWRDLASNFPPLPGARQIVVLRIESLQTSCGFGVPRYELVGERDSLVEWAQRKGEKGIGEYWEEWNHVSIDGLPTHLSREGRKPGSYLPGGRRQGP
jgi:hypothetical protein